MTRRNIYKERIPFATPSLPLSCASPRRYNSSSWEHSLYSWIFLNFIAQGTFRLGTSGLAALAGISLVACELVAYLNSTKVSGVISCIHRQSTRTRNAYMLECVKEGAKHKGAFLRWIKIRLHFTAYWRPDVTRCGKLPLFPWLGNIANVRFKSLFVLYVLIVNAIATVLVW
jgi:hypothetical protein